MLEVKNLSIAFKTDEGWVRVVEDVNFSLAKGETLGVVGESGCGKSVTMQSLMGLLPPERTRIEAEVLSFNGKNLLGLKESEWRRIRGNDISMVFQNPMTCLNPLMTCGKQITEVLRLHQKLKSSEASERAVSLLELMGLSDPKKTYRSYPHSLSGGMRQRVMIAMALACNPKLLIADEPTTALDVTIQAQILKLMRELQQKFSMSLILITHDLGVVESMVNSLQVMYAGQIIEKGETREVLSRPSHPYTRGLLASIPKVTARKPRLQSIEGQVPLPTEFPRGCRFYPRCPHGEDSCRTLEYQFFGDGSHQSACQFWDRAVKPAAPKR